jgi:hypothetical protein
MKEITKSYVNKIGRELNLQEKNEDHFPYVEIRPKDYATYPHHMVLSWEQKE